MKLLLKRAVRSITPPILWQTGSWILRDVFKFEQGKAYYDDLFQRTGHYRQHYTTSHYYFIWSVVADRVVRGGGTSVLDIGCGPGQFALLLSDRGLPHYHGIDLSEEAIRLAQAGCPRYSFTMADALTTDVFENFQYDTVISLEFLEHVHNDLSVLERIPRGKRFLGTVPNFPYESHVRHFNNDREVLDRYGRFFDNLRVDSFPEDEQRKTVYYLCEGIKS